MNLKSIYNQVKRVAVNMTATLLFIQNKFYPLLQLNPY